MKFLTLAFLSSSLLVSSALAAQDSKGKCGGNYSASSTSTGNEYCAQKELGDDAKNKQIAGSITHGVVAATCFTAYGMEQSSTGPQAMFTEAEAQAMGQACAWSDIGGNAADAAFTMAFNSKAQDITGQMTTSATTLGMSVMTNQQALGIAASNTTKSGEQGSTEATKKMGNSLIPAIMNTVQTGADIYGAAQASKVAKEGEANKMEAYQANGKASQMTGSASTQNLGGEGGGSGAASGSGVQANDSAATADAVKDLLANNPSSAAVLKKYADMTGQPTDQLVDAVVKGGINPVMAAMAQAQAAGLASGALTGNAATLAKQAEDAVAKAEGGESTSVAFASNSKGGAGGSKDEGLPDLASLMAQFLPKDENGKPLNPNGVNSKFAGRKIASENDGFHPASASLFEVVDARYASVIPKFLAGNLAVAPRTPASLVPGNMYLKK